MHLCILLNYWKQRKQKAEKQSGGKKKKSKGTTVRLKTNISTVKEN